MNRKLITLWFSLILALGAGCQKPEPALRFSVIVDEAEDLDLEQSVVLDGETIGRVTAVSPQSDGYRIEVEIDPQHSRRLQREFLFRVESGSSGSVLFIEDNGRGNTIEEGEVVDARGSWLDRLSSGLEKLGASAREAVDDLKTALEGTAATIKDSPEAQAFKESLSELAQDLSTAARGRYQHFVEQDLPRLEKEAEAYRDKLIEEGRSEEAEVFWKWYSRLSTAVKKATAGTSQEEEPQKDPGQ